MYQNPKIQESNAIIKEENDMARKTKGGRNEK